MAYRSASFGETWEFFDVDEKGWRAGRGGMAEGGCDCREGRQEAVVLLADGG